MASIGDTASLLRFKAVNSEPREDSGNDEASSAPTVPQPPQSPMRIQSVVVSGDESEAGQKNVWGPIRKAIDVIVYAMSANWQTFDSSLGSSRSCR